MYKPLTEENIKDFPNFKYSEFKCGCNGKYCNGYPVPFSYELARNLQTIRDHFKKPVHITSAIRCQKYNDSLSGSIKNSKHVKGWAVDFYISGVSYDTLAKYVKTLPYFNYCYRIKPNQNVIHYDIIAPDIKEDLIIKPVARDESKDQLKVLASNVEVKRFPGKDSDFRGYVQKDKIYNYKGIARNVGIVWYQIDDIQWVADEKNLEIYPVNINDDLSEDLEEANKKIQELTLRVAEQEGKINNLQTLNEALQKENKELLNDLEQFKLIYTCEKTGKKRITIKMTSGEKLYKKE